MELKFNSELKRLEEDKQALIFNFEKKM